MKKIIGIIAIVIIISGAFWAKGYYNSRYVVSDTYYTQIPLDEVNEDSWLVDNKGEKQEKGKSYDLIGFNKEGKEREVHFFKRGTAKDYYEPGTYIKVDVSKTIELDTNVVEKHNVPEKALEKISEKGTKK
ncbi:MULTISPECIES: YxeA family protein [unclassified Clostridium]|uniref:YxeA family protein n=1 Tax=unclassified Clostridium TaxID=2614128 RepID=UPI0013F00707|nr:MULTISPECIES: YxeA family protein [unclassified Clostridium]NFG62554.1 YxeA family protein [Clostridium botulinum]NFQ10755.1 YxeA family protein [Clostridium botulinum]